MNTFDKLAALSKENMEDILPKDEGKWAYIHEKDSELWNIEGSREDALGEGLAIAKEVGYDHVYLAPCSLTPIPELSADTLIDILRDESCETMPEEAQFLDVVTPEQEKELEDLVNGVVLAWIKKHDLYPKWWEVDMDKVEEIEVPEKE